MSQTMEDLLVNQNQIMVAMNQLLSNFKKDGQERKTPDYIKRRLATLDSYWQEFQSNHDQLNPFSNNSNEYFALNHYQQTHAFYLSTREAIKSAGTPSILRPATPLAGTSKAGVEGTLRSKNPVDSEATTFPEPPKFKSQGTNSKVDELLKKQTINFKAFYRTVANINVDTITEKWEFQDTLKTLETRWSAIDMLHWELEGELDGQDDSYEDKFNSYEMTYNNMKKSLNSKLWSVSHREQSTPKMEVPTFNGHYQNWVSFKDLFTEAIHNNPSLSQAQKMQFLKAKLKGEAEGLIHHLQISSENYSTCWEILNHRYNNKLLIFTSHMNTLTNLPVMHQPSVYYVKRIHDTTIECVNAIKNMGADVSTWDPIICYLMSNKLDANTHSEYIASLKQPRELPILSDFLVFLEAKFTSMESSRRKQDQKAPNSNAKSSKDNNINNKNINRNSKQSYSSNKNVSKSNGKIHNKRTCPLCKNGHGLFHCEQYIEMSPVDKKQFVVDNKLCENCLFSHKGKECISTKRCNECDGSHNTILHDAFAQTPNQAIPKAGNSHTLPEQNQQVSTHVAQQRDVPETLLSTAVIKVQKCDGSYLNMRALIDQGSQTSLITENAAQQLGLPRQRCKGVISGIGARDNACKGVININCSSRRESYSFNTDVFIMKTLTKNLPTYTFAKPTWSYLENIELADPDFYVSRPVDIIFGADIYSNIIMEGICRLEQTTPIAQQTRLGWILCGNVNVIQCNVVQFDIDQLQKFWETEEIAESTSLSSDDQECMQFYSSTTNRLLDGRYVVRLPLKTNLQEQLGYSKSKAIAQFGHLENKLIKNENIAKEYKKFIHEYLTLGHMKSAICNAKLECFLPHHCVLRDDSTTTSLRVVFNASSRTSSGQSLNDLMNKGPNLQQDLQSLILKWRQYQFAFTADIEKMFRQILVYNEDQSLQKIVWRDSPRDKLQKYQLTTVTYGTKAAPFLAMMTLKQLANDERSDYPEASKVLEESFYMDDLLHGTHSVSAARQLQQDLNELLKRGGFNLRKWASNDPHLLHDEIPCQQQSKSFRQPESTKTLGLRWNPVKDNFTFEPKIDSTVNKATKRSVLSDISKFFDPLGWLTPTTTKLKILFQRIWTSQVQWDEQIPEDIFEEWNKLKADIDNISQVKIPRWLGTKPERRVELHGFCDSSTKAYACVIYCKVYNEQTSIILVAGKSRIIPANKNISLPRLELCGAYLLAKLMAKVKASLTDYKIDIYGWIDSTAVLGWLQGDPGRWQAFVANRTRFITEIMPPACWRYVKSAENPADCASRGLSMSQLLQHPLWWQGPSWLQTVKADERNEEIKYTTTLEIKPQKQVNTVIKQIEEDSIIVNLLKSHSSFTKIVHILAWVYRFLTSKQNNMQTSYLTLEEIRKAKMKIIKQVQQQEFAEEIKSLKEKGKLSNKSRILKLNPFLDSFGLLRVGGRLRHAHIHADMQHPIIIPQRGRLTELLIEHAYKRTFHGGARLTSGFIRQKYWIIGGNGATKKQIRLCVKCRKLSPNKHNQIMSDLPEARSNPSRPFEHNLPPGKWSMGRVVDLHPRADGFVRVISLKTKNGILKRPITKISVLPVNQNLTESSENVQEELKTNREQTKPQRKAKRVSVTTLFTSLLLFMTIITGGYCDFQSTRFRPNQSLYFDKLSNMQIIRDEWKLIIYYDMQPYWEGITALNKYTKSLEQSCNTIRNIMNCDIILLQLVQGLGELEYYNQMLLGQHSNEQRARQRRGLIDGVGYLANSLFGVLDARFAEQYRQDITLLRDNQRHIASYWKNQTSIIEVEYNLLKRTEQSMNRQHKMVSQHIFSIEKALNQLQSETQNMSIVNELTVGAIIGSNMLHNLKSLQSTLLDTITDIYQGQFNPHLLTPVQLQDQLSTIASQLPKDVTLPVDNVQIDLRKIYKLLKVKTRMLKEYLIFEIRLPLISRDTFEIFQIFSIPQVKGTDMVSIQPISDYVAINLKKDTYLTMTEKTLTSCLISDAYLCHIQRPIYHLNEDKDFCQTEEFECATRISPCKNSWFESNTINNYIYFCCDQCSLRIMCEDQVASHQLTGAGLVAIENGCIIKTQAFTLIAHRQQSSQLNIKPDVYTPMIPPINHIINITIPHMITMNDSETDQNQMDLDELGRKIKIMKDNAAIAESISVHGIHHYTAIYIIVGIAGAAGLVYAWRRVRAWSVPAAPAPAPTPAQGAPAPPARSNNDNQCAILGDRVFYHSVSELNDNNQSSVSNLNSARVNKATSPISVR